MIIQPVIKYFKGVLSEFRLISFPSHKTVAIETVLVIISIMVAVIVLAILDFLFSQIISFIIK